jgi:hypothetical protein
MFAAGVLELERCASRLEGWRRAKMHGGDVSVLSWSLSNSMPILDDLEFGD